MEYKYSRKTNINSQYATGDLITVCTGDTRITYTFKRQDFKKVIMYRCPLRQFGPKIGDTYMNSEILISILKGESCDKRFTPCAYNCSSVGCWCSHIDMIPVHIATYRFLRCYCRKSRNRLVAEYIVQVRHMLREMTAAIRYMIYCKYVPLMYNSWYEYKYPALAERDKYTHIGYKSTNESRLVITMYRMLYINTLHFTDFKCDNIPDECVKFLDSFLIEPRRCTDIFPIRTLGDILLLGLGKCYAYSETNYVFTK